MVDPRNVEAGPLGERPGSAADPGRRRLLLAGLIAAPFIFTLAARPAMAKDLGRGSLGLYPGDYRGDDGGRPERGRRPATSSQQNRPDTIRRR
jgi:hypothetical protein